ncbi:MAG: low temperature requirement protein A, partial [Phenylobacterium sp.]
FLMLAVWWAWIYTTWITNWLDPEHPLVRAMLFALMAAGLVLSTSLTDAFDGRALPFAAAYVSIQVGRTLFMLWACRHEAPLCRNFQRVLAWLATSGVVWIAGAFAEGTARFALWGLALGIEYISPAVAFWTPGLGRTPTHDWNVEGGHMAERCGLFIIICLGESILVTGATFAELAWSPSVVAAFATAFVGSVALWWIYFSAHADMASHAISESADPGRIARVSYTYAHIPLVAGIIVTAAGDELVLAHPSGLLSPAIAWVLVGGPALFLAGALWFKWSVFRVIARPRATGLLLLLGTGALTPWLTPLGLSAAVTGVLVLVGAWETWIRFRQGHDATAPLPTHKPA